MDYKLFFIVLFFRLTFSHGQHENIPYQNVENICESCICLTAVDPDHKVHYVMSCIKKNFSHILPRWPTKFGKNHNGVDIVASFSGNDIELLQQLPASNASLTFSCRHCGLKQIQAPAFMDVPNIDRLDLSWNYLKSEELTPDVFRGPFKLSEYQPIALTELDLSHNLITTLDKSLFIHLPKLKKLNLSYNAFEIFDMSSTSALSSVNSLEYLDLSFAGISAIPQSIFSSLPHLKSLQLAGNNFKKIPQLNLVGRTLEILNMGGNPISELTEESFSGLKVLKRLNISAMNNLVKIENGTFALLETLEDIFCSHNPNLAEFDLKSLLHCTNLTHLDISFCAIKSISLSMDLSQIIAPNKTTASLPLPWTKLLTFATVGNPWICDCELFETLEFMGSHHFHTETETRCDSPYILSGELFSNLTALEVCLLQIPKKYSIVDDDPPRFLRKRYIILTLVTASVVIIVGLLIGFIVAFIRRRLKRDDFGVEPIRYTSVRSSNLSAFSNINANGNGNVSHA